MKKIVRRF